MCGICGILDRHDRGRPILAMNEAQRHRGPDDEGYLLVSTATGAWREAGGRGTPAALGLPALAQLESEGADLILGSRRLAILDLSPAGHMPMSYAGETLWLVHNGEIYNYRELRHELKRLGHQFRSDSDTEVILAAYAEWGVDCLARFNGMFAFALWDQRLRRLFCARDRFGIKPFYYYHGEGLFVFASELKALLQHPSVPREPNDPIIFDYLARGLSDHTAETFFHGVLALPAGHFALIETAALSVSIRRWWDIQINPAVSGLADGAEEAVAQEFAVLLEDAVRLRLRSDVAVGSCLSGGLDSSSVVSLANRLLLEEEVVPRHLVGKHQKTFTARNEQPEIDEHRYSSLIVRQTGAEENLVTPNGATLWTEIESFIWHLDEPVDSTSQYPQWNVMRLARQRGVTVLLDGQGGDEILAGYYAYLPPYLGQIRQQQGWLAAIRAGWDVARTGGAPAVNLLADEGLRRLPWRLQQVSQRLRRPRLAPGQGGTGLQAWQLPEAFIQQNWERRWRPGADAGIDGLVGILHRDLTATNLPKLLRYEDRNSMAFSLETRLPFLDYRLVQMVFSLPLDYRIRHGWSKWLLRRAMQDRLPAEICWRRSKMGFPTPEQSWLREGDSRLREVLQHGAADPRIGRYVRPETLMTMSRLAPDALAATPGLWRIINLIIWHDLFFHRFNQGAGRAAEIEPVALVKGS